MPTTKKAAVESDRLGDALLGIRGVAGWPVKGITDDGVSVVSQLRAQLVLASCFQF
jgi:hypothetical protein